MEDRTNYGQSLMHMVKGNLGTGILAMPASFAHVGLINATLCLPLLCLISTYCVHLLIDSARLLESKTKDLNVEYANLAEHSFKSGPSWMRPLSYLMSRLVDGTLLLAQIGVCCVYLVFVSDNIISIFSSYSIHVSDRTVFVAILPIALSLSYIRTLSRLAIASTLANVLEVAGIALTLQYLLRGLEDIDLTDRVKLKSLDSIALGFGSAMFAFEGISVVLPVYAKMRQPHRMSDCSGIVNVAYSILLVLYFVVGMSGYVRYGDLAGDSITLNLPPEPLYDAVRAMFMMAVFLTYPLQFYVPNEIIWNWIKRTILNRASIEPAAPSRDGPAPVSPEAPADPERAVARSTANNVWATEGESVTVRSNMRVFPGEQTEGSHRSAEQLSGEEEDRKLVKYEYVCRTGLVLLTFVLAISVPKLNLLMDLIGSITGTLLSLILPAVIHLATFWNETEGLSKMLIILIDTFIILFGATAGVCGATSSMASIIRSFDL